MSDRPKIRSDLVIQEISAKKGDVHYVIKDPITHAYFKVGEAEYFIISSFDGTNTLPEVAAKVREKLGEEVSEEELAGFVEQMQELCFLDNELTRKELLKKQKEASFEKPETTLGKLVFVRIKAFNPGKLFDRLINYVRPFFTPYFVWLAVIAIFIAFLITLYNGPDIARGIAKLLSVEGIILLYVCIPFVVLFHEFAHGLTLKYYGGEVREIGFLLIYFQPAFYCNVSDAWMLPKKSQRLWVSFSGGFFQIFIWALAVIVWRITAPELFINKVSLAVMTFSGIATLFNFNPLLRYDGYYLLSDYVEIPNLRTKAKNYWRAKLKSLFTGGEKGLDDFTSRERKIYFYYGFLSFIYIVFVLGYFFILLEQFLVSELGGIGFIIFAAVMLFLFRNVLIDGAHLLGTLLKRKNTIIIGLPILVILILVIFLGSLPLRIGGEVVIEPIHSLILKYDNQGYLQLIRFDPFNTSPDKQREVSVFGGEYTTTSLVPLVSLHDTVKAGETIARLANSETGRFINEYRAQMERAKEELAILKQGARPEEIRQARNTVEELDAELEQASRNLDRMNEMLEKQVVAPQQWEDARADSVVKAARLNKAKNELDLLLAGSRPEAIRAKEAEIEELKGKIEFYQQQQDLAAIKSTIDGVVLTLDTGEIVCEVAPLDTVVAAITLSEKELSDIAIDQRVKFKARGYPSLTFEGNISVIGQKIFIDMNDRRIFKVFCDVPNENHLLKPGMTGVAYVYAGDKKISFLIYRKLFRTIRTEFWHWFDWF